MFIELNPYSMSKFIKKYFPELFRMGISVFDSYLDICTFNNISMNEL